MLMAFARTDEGEKLNYPHGSKTFQCSSCFGTLMGDIHQRMCDCDSGDTHGTVPLGPASKLSVVFDDGFVLGYSAM